MFGRLGRARTRDADPTLADSRYTGTWRPQGAALAGATGAATRGGEGLQTWRQNRPANPQGGDDFRAMLDPRPGPARPQTGGALMFRDPSFDTLLGQDELNRSHNAIVNRPNVLIRDPQVIPWEAAPPTLFPERPITDADNAPDLCGGKP